MLTDQTFEPIPIIGVGPELFTTADGKKLDYGTLELFQKVFLVVPIFRFVFLAYADSVRYPFSVQNLFATLSDLGIQFNVKLIESYLTLESLQQAQGLVRLCDFLYSLEFTFKVAVSNSINVSSLPKDTFLLLLNDFQTGDLPYSTKKFRALMKHYGH